MNVQTKIAPARRKLSIATDKPVRPARMVIPSAPQVYPLRQLVRAKENVRHTRIDEDVAGLADDIRAHGLLQSLIGYVVAGGRHNSIHIVGGGRRLQALDSLMMDDVIDGEFPVPVLIRDAEQAVELSLAENLQQRTMSPVDEFLAFRALIDTGHHSPADLAKRFGFSERVVKQRLRLAELAPDILDALANRAITIDAAMAYAGTQDQALQAQIFKTEKKRSWDAHAVRNIKHALSAKGMKTSHPIFRFVGAEAYERRGGRYEDDLFRDDAVAGDDRVLADPILLQTIATEHIEFQMVRRLREFQAREDLSPTISGFVIVPGIKLLSWGYSGAIAAPPGFAQADRHDHAPMWRTIRNNGTDVRVLVGIDDKGELVLWPRTVFVPKAQKQAVAPAQQGHQSATLTPEQVAAAARQRGTVRWARRLAVNALGGSPLFAGTPLEGRGYWPDSYRDHVTPTTVDGVAGMLVPVDIFVSDAEIAAQRKSADARYDQELADIELARAAEREKREAADRRDRELRDMEPPAVVVIDGAPWERAEDGSYASTVDEGDAFDSWEHLLDVMDGSDIGQVFATRDAFDAAMGATA